MIIVLMLNFELLGCPKEMVALVWANSFQRSYESAGLIALSVFLLKTGLDGLLTN